MTHFKTFAAIVLLAALSSCGGGNKQGSNTDSTSTTTITGAISIDGSSTVFPILEAVAEEFMKANPQAKVTIGISGTGGGFKKFGRGELDIANASRHIKQTEADACTQNGIEYLELSVAYDGLAIVTNTKNTWLDKVTVAELKKMWEPEAQDKVKSWDMVRTGFPKKDLHLFGAGTASGTYDYFTEAIVGKSGSSRGDYTASEDDNVLVQGIEGDDNALGFFGLGYYIENKDKLKLIPVDNGTETVSPSIETVRNGTYKPLSRPLFIYVSKKAAARPEVQAFIKFAIANAGLLAEEVGYVPMKDEEYKEQTAKFDAFVTK